MAHVGYADGTQVDVPIDFPGDPPNVIVNSLQPHMFTARASLPAGLTHNGWPVCRVCLDGHSDQPFQVDWNPDTRLIVIGGIFPFPRGYGSVVQAGRQMTGLALFRQDPQMVGRTPVRLTLRFPGEATAVGTVYRADVADGHVCVQFQAAVLPDGEREPVPAGRLGSAADGELQMFDGRGALFWKAAASRLFPASN